jgi:hypothetical protein
MRQITWAVTWIVVGLATTLATANVLTHNAQLNRARPAAFEPPAPTPEPVIKPIARARPASEFGRSVTPANFRQRGSD